MRITRLTNPLLILASSFVVGCGDGSPVAVRVDAGTDTYTPIVGLDAVGVSDSVVGFDIAFPADTVPVADTASPADVVGPQDTASPEDTTPPTDLSTPEDTSSAADTTVPVDTVTASDADTTAPEDVVAPPDTTPPSDVAGAMTVVYQLDDVAFTDDDSGLTIEALDDGPTMTLVRDGLAMTLAANTGNLNQTASGFGINATGSGDATDQIDGGAAINEVLSVTFGSDVVLNSIKLSSFSGADQASVTIGTGAAMPVTSSGVFDLGGAALAAGQTLAIAFVAGNGFQVDAITVSLP